MNRTLYVVSPLSRLSDLGSCSCDCLLVLGPGLAEQVEGQRPGRWNLMNLGGDRLRKDMACSCWKGMELAAVA